MSNRVAELVVATLITMFCFIFLMLLPSLDIKPHLSQKKSALWLLSESKSNRLEDLPQDGFRIAEKSPKILETK